MGVSRMAKVVVLQNAVASTSLTGTTSETTLSNGTVTLPVLGPNDQFQIDALFSHTGTAGTFTPKIKLGSTVIVGNSAIGATNLSIQYFQVVGNRGATNSQIFFTPPTNLGVSTTPIQTGSEETNAGAVITFTGTLASAADSMKLERYKITITRG